MVEVDTACRCAIETIGGMFFRKLRTSAIRVLFMPAALSGMSVHVCCWIYRIRLTTSCDVLGGGSVVTMPVLSRGCSVLVLASDWLLLTPACGVVAALRRGWLPKGEEAERRSWMGDFLGRDCSGFGTPVALKDISMICTDQ